MFDDFGYTTDDFFIFCSTLDFSYHVETSLNETIKKDIPTFVASEVKTSEIAIEEISFENGVASNPLVLDEIGRPSIELGTDTETDIDENLSTL